MRLLALLLQIKCTLYFQFRLPKQKNRLLGFRERSLRRVLYTICSPVDEENSTAALQEFPPPTTNEQPVFVKERSHKYRLFCCQREGVSWAMTPLSVASGRKRYNTLDFASKVVCQQGAARPYWMTQSRGDLPLGLPFIFATKHHPHLKECSDDVMSENILLRQKTTKAQSLVVSSGLDTAMAQWIQNQ